MATIPAYRAYLETEWKPEDNHALWITHVLRYDASKKQAVATSFTSSEGFRLSDNGYANHVIDELLGQNWKAYAQSRHDEVVGADKEDVLAWEEKVFGCATPDLQQLSSIDTSAIKGDLDPIYSYGATLEELLTISE